MTGVRPAARAVTASMMRDMVGCEHRVALDLNGDQAARDPVGAFTAMLWEAGRVHEAAVLAGLAPDALDLRGLSGPERETRTAKAMDGDAQVLLGARIAHDDLLGDPDVLRRDGRVWVAGDVKSGNALDDGRPKRDYAAQLAHYALILRLSGRGDGRTAFVLDRNGDLVEYRLDERAGPRSPSPSDAHAEMLPRARAIRDGAPTRPALSADCKSCHWRTACKARLREDDDLTLVAELGRAARDALLPTAPTVAALAALDPVAAAAGMPKVKGVGPARLALFVERARHLKEPAAKPYAREALPLTRRSREFFLDVEADPLAGDLIYLHGVLERTSGPGDDRERFHAFFADDPVRGEHDAFAAAMALLGSDPAAPVYVYSAYERTSYRTLQARYPDVCTADEIEVLFHSSRTVDLLTSIVRPLTEWPASDRSIKTLARLCGFEWRDPDPGGANSIEWFRSWRATGDPAVRERILQYNEDDVIASRVLFDSLMVLRVRP